MKVTEEYFSDKIELFGTTPQGVDWNGDHSQDVRLEQLLKILPPQFEGRLNDLGCGYGLLYKKLVGCGFCGNYLGYDISQKMITAGEKYLTDIGAKSFKLSLISRPEEMEMADYSLASGIFNLRFHESEEEWKKKVVHTINVMNEVSRKGFSFNMLTSYSDRERMKDHLFYGDPLFFFDYCKRNFSRNVALLHDYEIYDFTILVRK